MTKKFQHLVSYFHKYVLPLFGKVFVDLDMRKCLNRGRRAKDTEVAEVTVDMNQLKSGSETEEWYNLRGVTPIGEWGSVRLRLR